MQNQNTGENPLQNQLLLLEHLVRNFRNWPLRKTSHYTQKTGMTLFSSLYGNFKTKITFISQYIDFAFNLFSRPRGLSLIYLNNA